MKLRHLAWLAIFVPAVALAQDTKISDLPNDAALSGGELFVSAQGGVTSNISLTQIDGFVGAGGESIVNDITEAPYNATCNGVADDSAAFELAVDTGGVFFIPPGSRCLLSSTSNHTWNKNVTFYGLAGAERDTHIDIDSADNFLLAAGGEVHLRNLTFKNGDDFIFANTLAGTVEAIECINTIWDNVNTPCVRYSTITPNSASVVNRFIFKNNHVENAPATSRGLFFFGPFTLRDVQVTGNFITGGKNGINVGFMPDAAAKAELLNLSRFIISGNHVKNIDGNNTGAATVACIFAEGIYINISNNVCEDIDDSTQLDDLECIYVKAQQAVIANNVLFNCGREEAGIDLKGMTGAPESCTISACSERYLVIGNIIDYTKSDSGGYNCINIQATDVLVIGNIISGCTFRGVKVANAGDYNNIEVRNNQFYGLRGDGVFDVQGDHDNVVFEGNTVWEYNDAETSFFYGVRLDVGSGQTMRWVRIANNRFILADPTDDDTTGCLRVSNSGTIEDLEFVGNLCHKDADTGVLLDESGTIERLTIAGNNFNGVGDPYSEGTQTVNNCEVWANRGWKIDEDSCGAASGGDT